MTDDDLRRERLLAYAAGHEEGLRVVRLTRLEKLAIEYGILSLASDPRGPFSSQQTSLRGLLARSIVSEETT